MRPRGETAHWAPVLNEEPSRDPETPPRHPPRDGKTRSRRNAAPGCRSAPFAARSGEARRAPRAPRPRRPCPGPPLTGLGSRVRLPPSAPRGSPATSPRPRRHGRHVWPGSWPSTAWRRPVTSRLQRDGPQVGLARTPRPPRFLPPAPCCSSLGDTRLREGSSLRRPDAALSMDRTCWKGKPTETWRVRGGRGRGRGWGPGPGPGPLTRAGLLSRVDADSCSLCTRNH